MGCQCAKKNDEEIDELKKESLDGINPEEKDNNYNNDVKKKDDVFGSNMEDRNNNEEGNENQVKTRKVNNNNEADEDYIEKINEEKNAKYADYPEKMLEIINKIREDPA
jgi:hypothetical protein